MDPATGKFKAGLFMRMAEEKLLANDIAEARMLAHRASALCPSRPGVTHTVDALDVIFAAATKKLPSGRTDWFSVLGVDASADLGAAKKRYMALCLRTHPDKNPSAAAGQAFDIVRQAWDAVSSSLPLQPSSTSCQRNDAGNHPSAAEAPSTPPRSDEASCNSSPPQPPSRPPREPTSCPWTRRRPAKAKKRGSPINDGRNGHYEKYGRSRSQASSTGSGKYACPVCHAEFLCYPKSAWSGGAIAVLMKCPACQERIYVE